MMKLNCTTEDPRDTHDDAEEPDYTDKELYD